MQDDSTAPLIGLARLPHDLRRLLDEAAANADAAASAFHRVADAWDEAAIEELGRLELEAGRIAGDFVSQLRNGRVSSDDRARLLTLTRAVEDAIEALTASAHGVAGCDCGDHGRDLGAVVRDAVRATARALRLFAAQSEPGDDRGTELERERRRIQRAAFVADAEGPGAVLAVIRRRACIEELGRAFDAAHRAIETIDRTRSAGL